MHHVLQRKSKKKRNCCALFFQQSCRESKNWNKLNPKKYNEPFFLWPQNLNPNNDYTSLNSHLNTKHILHPNPCSLPGRGSPNWPGVMLRNERDTRVHFCSMGWKSKRHHIVIKHTSDAREQHVNKRMHHIKTCITSTFRRGGFDVCVLVYSWDLWGLLFMYLCVCICVLVKASELVCLWEGGVSETHPMDIQDCATGRVISYYIHRCLCYNPILPVGVE